MLLSKIKLGKNIISKRFFSSIKPPISFNFLEEHKSIKSMVENFRIKEIEPFANEFNRKEKFNLDLFKKTGELGLLGLTVDEKYGGYNLDAITSCIVHQEISKSDPAFCLSYLAHSVLFVNNLFQNGNEKQKEKYLPDAISGKIIGGMGMSEPNAGTDVLGMKTNIKEKDDHYILNGSKMWITNASINGVLGDVFLVYANSNKGLSMVIVDKEYEGFELMQDIKNKSGMRASGTGQISFDNVKIHKDNLVGDEGKAVVCMMKNLEIERLVLAAMSLGIAERSLEEMIKYANERESFGKKINQFGQIQQMIGDSFAEYQASMSYVYLLASQLNLNEAGNRLDSDGVKLFCAKTAKNIADRSIQVLGGNGYIDEYIVERLWRDSKLIEIGGGTNESHQKNITKDLVKFL
jgi:isovaleryl-CoA dehydrogenase